MSVAYRLAPALACLLALAACAPPPLNRSGLQAATAVPTLDTGDAAALCTAVSQHWGFDWALTIRALEALRALNALCSDGLAIDGRLYVAYIAYGTELEQQGQRDAAIQAYQTAFNYDRVGAEAARRLRLLGVVTPAPPPGCAPDEVARLTADLPAYTPTTGSFVGVSGRRFTLDGAPYALHGVAYYPRDYPYRRFLTEMDIAAAETELDLIRAAGINTLRVFLWHEGMFTCPGNGAVPLADAFIRFDLLLRAAAARGLRLIVVLNHYPDLSSFPLYDSPRHTMEQIAFIAARYRDEPAVLAWDLRDAGDFDYLGADGFGGAFSRERVLTWLTDAAMRVRTAAPHHLITAGWKTDSQATLPVVDFLSFQHYGDIDALRQRAAELLAVSDKPVLLAGTGYSTFTLTEAQQRTGLQLALQAVRETQLAGWVVWMAFDLPLSAACTPPGCPAQDNPDVHYGLWNTSYFPKLALDAVLLTTGGR